MLKARKLKYKRINSQKQISDKEWIEGKKLTKCQTIYIGRNEENIVEIIQQSTQSRIEVDKEQIPKLIKALQEVKNEQ